ncbi:MAG: hypothetical protein Q8P70_01600 [bacterium]|nr:hypothetical protein [bacterium]
MTYDENILTTPFAEDEDDLGDDEFEPLSGLDDEEEEEEEEE